MEVEDSVPSYTCRRVRDDFPVDGHLFKSPWTEIKPVWFLPATLEAGTRLEHVRNELHDAAYFATGYSHGVDCNVISPDYQLTAFGACWTDTHLYLGFRCMDSDIWSTFTRRDDPLYEEEVVEAFLSPTADPRHYYELNISPANVIFDARIHSPDLHRRSMEVDPAWNCPGLATAVRIYGTLNERTDVDTGWSVEAAIPFAAFPEAGAPSAGDEWRANFFRIDRASHPSRVEYTCWSPTREVPANFHVPARFGVICFEA